MDFGYAELDITPPAGLELSGYGYFLRRRALEVLDPLMARAVAFHDDLRCAVLVQLDLLALDTKFVAAVRRAAARSYGLRPGAVMLHCTHTHSAPAVRRLFGCGDTSPVFLRRLRAQIVAVIGQALATLAPAGRTARFEGARFDGFAFNRAGGAPPDAEIRGVSVSFADAKPLVLLSYACHPVTLGPNRAYSADYCGAVLRACAARDLRAVFLNGCSGDVAPRLQGIAPDALIGVGSAFADAVEAGLSKATPWTPQRLRIGTRTVQLDADADADYASRPSPPDPSDPPLARVARACDAHLQALARAGRLDTATAVEVQTFGLGDVVVTALGAEVFEALGAQLRAAFPAHLLLLASTSNGVAGYLMTAEDLAAEGYASTRGRRIYGLPRLRPESGERFVAAATASIAEVLWT